MGWEEKCKDCMHGRCSTCKGRGTNPGMFGNCTKCHGQGGSPCARHK